jgi:hypothetical protein
MYWEGKDAQDHVVWDRHCDGRRRNHRLGRDGSRSKNGPEIVSVEINPLGLMKASTGLQVEVWEWF